MIPAIRQAFNAAFTPERYAAYVADLASLYNYDIEFRIAETPVFIPKDLKHKVVQACDDIISVLLRPDFKALTEGAVPANLKVPAEDGHTQFLAIDFAICEGADGSLEPQLIELQGFPSLYGFQENISQMALKHWDIPENFDYLFSGLTSETYIDLLRRTILGGHAPENVILLEVEPEKQKTKVDFYATKAMVGIQYICISEVIREGRKLFYLHDGVKTPIHRIYNRVIFDELVQRQDLKLAFHLTEEVDVEWAGHPNWFFRISKYTLPFLKSPYVPETHFLHQLRAWPDDLENWVLKPLFSFAGQGVKVNITQADLDAVTDPENYILMRKVHYAGALQSPVAPIKTELRMLYLWPTPDERPTLATSLVRLSQSVMMGVRFNKDFTWVGGSMAFFEKD